MKALTKIKSALALWAEGQIKFDEANKTLSGGPASYYYEKLDDYVTALFTRFAPFHEGEKVIIKKAPPCNNGWAHCKHFLIVGAIGTVKEVDYRDNQFIAAVEWDNETWIDSMNIERPVESRHTFLMWESQIKALDHEPE